VDGDQELLADVPAGYSAAVISSAGNGERKVTWYTEIAAVTLSPYAARRTGAALFELVNGEWQEAHLEHAE
jgi:alkylated DNA nucleotide flippase Atl1